MTIKTLSVRGMGLYIRGLSKSRHGTPKQAAKKAKDHGISHVAIMAVWQDYQKGKFRHLRGNLVKDRFVAYADAFEAQGIDVGLWFYPWGGHEERLLEDLHAACEKAKIAYVLDDGELGHKWRSRGRGNTNDVGTMRGGQREAFEGGKVTAAKATRIHQVHELWDGLQTLVSDGHTPLMGATAYGMAQYHPTFPWEAKLERADFLSPQLYTATPKQVDQGIAKWWEYAGGNMQIDKSTNMSFNIPMVPSIGLFGEKSGSKMSAHLENFVDGEEEIDGFLGWSWRQTSRQEWRILSKWAERMNRGIMEL